MKASSSARPPDRGQHPGSLRQLIRGAPPHHQRLPAYTEPGGVFFWDNTPDQVEPVTATGEAREARTAQTPVWPRAGGGVQDMDGWRMYVVSRPEFPGGAPSPGAEEAQVVGGTKPGAVVAVRPSAPSTLRHRSYTGSHLAPSFRRCALVGCGGSEPTGRRALWTIPRARPISRARRRRSRTGSLRCTPRALRARR